MLSKFFALTLLISFLFRSFSLFPNGDALIIEDETFCTLSCSDSQPSCCCESPDEKDETFTSQSPLLSNNFIFTTCDSPSKDCYFSGLSNLFFSLFLQFPYLLTNTTEWYNQSYILTKCSFVSGIFHPPQLLLN